jgi:hypothetical protein
MSKVLRLFKNGNNNISDWQEQTNYAYDSSNRAQINDTIKASKFYDITSIPSPFARMQLVKDAFREIVKTGRTRQTPWNGIHGTNPKLLIIGT